LYEIRTKHGWTQRELANRVKLPQSLVSMHLSGARRILGNHLKHYLAVMNKGEGRRFTAAWMREHLDES
jgi:transcriptional regulator with XRE-family HTH domain